jgi:hypothetical protein
MLVRFPLLKGSSQILTQNFYEENICKAFELNIIIEISMVSYVGI